MCFVPQRRALFQHLNFHKCSGAEVSLTFWLRNMLRATTVCNYFWSLISPDGSAPAALASLLFDPPELQNIGKTKFRDFSTLPFCAPSSSFFWLFLFSDLFFPFFLWLLSCPYCQSLISKFPGLYTRTHTYTHTYNHIYIYLMLAHYMYCVFFLWCCLFIMTVESLRLSSHRHPWLPRHCWALTAEAVNMQFTNNATGPQDRSVITGVAVTVETIGSSLGF